MTNIVGSLTTELRITGRILRETAMGLKRTGWMNLIIIVTMASILSMFGIVVALIIQMKFLVQYIGTELEISAYLKDGVKTQAISQKLATIPHVKKITIIPKEKAWADWQKDYPLPEIENPLPDTLHIQLKNKDYIPQTVEKLKSFPEIEGVQYAKKALAKIKHITDIVSGVGLMASFFFGALTLFIINNTIHLLIQAKSREIEILRMMGVGNWYIRLPFLIQGAIYGLVGALVSCLVISFVMEFLMELFKYLEFQTSDLLVNYVRVILILMGVLVGSGGAYVAVRKYLQV